MARCMGCRKNLLRCKCDLTISGGAPTRWVKDGARKGTFMKNGNEWCGWCSRRVVDGQCQNRQCHRRYG